jgi:hypothetical protein
MAAIFLRHRGMTQSEREAIGPMRVFPHVGFAVVGFALWLTYAITDNDATGWAATAAIGAAFLIAGTFLLTRDQHRMAQLGPLHSSDVAARAPSPVAAEQYIPIVLASAHGLLGSATLVLVLLERAGVGGS